MKSLLNKVVSGAASVGVFLVGCALAGLGLWLMVVLAMFAFAVIGLGILAAPVIALIQSSENKDTETVAA